MKTLTQLFLLFILPATLIAVDKPAMETTDVVFRELRYDAKVSDDEARFAVAITAESTAKQEAVAVLFDGELALLPPKLPDALRIEREGNVYRLFIPKPGKYQFKEEIVARSEEHTSELQ